MDDFDLRMERAAIEGAAFTKPTLGPLVLESTNDALATLEATQQEIERVQS